MKKRPRKVVSYNMSRIRSEGTKLEERLDSILRSFPYELSNHPGMYGKPDFAYPKLRIVVFADSDFWHGFAWETKKKEIKTNQDFWLKKIERNMLRDAEVTCKLKAEGWTVIRLWGHDILRNPNKCKTVIEEAIAKAKTTMTT